MNKIIGPTYYVRHPDDSYSVADPQPSPLSVWNDARHVLPPIDVPVWAYEGGGFYFAVRVDHDEGGLVWTRSYVEPTFSEGKWTSDDAEFDDDYNPTHWQYLPEPPHDHDDY